jgi:uncharacterized membrane protein
MPDARNLVFAWAATGRLPEAEVARALAVAGVTPDRRAWRQFIERLLLGFGVLCVGAGAVFLVASNWQAMSRFQKFGLAEVALAAAIAICWWQGLDSRIGQSALVVAALFTGALLALVGQVYQTGADTYELFVAWAVAIAAWVAVARMPVLWLLWIGLVDMAILLYFESFPGRFRWLFNQWNFLWALFAFNVVAQGVWEGLAARGIAWLAAPWAIRVLALAAGAPVTAAAMMYGFEFARASAWTLPVYAAWLAAMYWAYRRRRIDLFVLAGCVLSIALVAAALSLRVFRSPDAGVLLLIGLVVTAIATAGARWLRRVAAEGAAP